MTKLIIMTGARFNKSALAILQDNCEVSFYEDEVQKDDATVLWIDHKVRVDKNLMKEFPNLSEVITVTTGITHIDNDLLERKNIKVISLKDHKAFLAEEITSSSEFAWTLLLAGNALLGLKQNVTGQELAESVSTARLQLKGSRIGIIGLGRIGSNIAKYAKAFDMTVYYHDVVFNQEKSFGAATFLSSIQQLFLSVDYLILSASVSDPKKEILNQQLLGTLRGIRGIVNISRGCLIDETAIVQLLDSTRLGFYATDVLSVEDFPSDNKRIEVAKRLKDHPKVLVTPHIAGLSADARAKVEYHMARAFVGSDCLCTN
jgi:phosphoglycerate dehydrogenase-like enzyme